MGLFQNRKYSKNSVKFLRDLLKDNVCFVTNNLNLNTIFYIATERNNSYDEVRDFLKTIHNSKNWIIYDLTAKDRYFALDYMDKNHGSDFEDLLQYSAAKNSNCSLIVTNDKDFPNIDIALKRTNPNLID